jgi:hypothetical protein
VAALMTKLARDMQISALEMAQRSTEVAASVARTRGAR